VDCILLVQYTIQLQALLNVVMNLKVPEKSRTFFSKLNFKLSNYLNHEGNHIFGWMY
jgi:hypothetical protein